MFFSIENNGPDVIATDYFDSKHAQRGYFYLSTNAGCVRLLVPDNQTNAIPEFKTAECVILSRGPWPEQGKVDGLELLFEDFSNIPYVIHLGVEQCDMLPDGKGDWTFAVWTRNGKRFECPLKYRKVKEIPCMKAWGE